MHILLLFLLVACAPKQTEVIKLGGNLALTGKLALYGINERNGIELAVKDINARGGIKGKQLVFITEDNQGDAKTAVTAMQKLLDVDRVDIVFTAFTHITQAIAPSAQNASKILLYQSTVADMARAHPFVFRDYMDIGEQGRDLAAYAISQGHSAFSYIGEMSDVCEGFLETFVDRLGGDGKIVSKQTFDPAEKDFRTYLLKANEVNPDAFVFCA